MQDYTGQQIGDYHVLRRLGRGAMADVYLAEQQSLARQVALKILKTDLATDATYVSRFQHEARSAAQLVHSNIVQVYEVGRSGDAHFIAQEYVAGKNLGELAQQQGRLQPGVVLDILRQSAAALCKAAEGGVVHRDIKPENLMLTQGGEVKVADFGLARLSTPSDQQLTQVGVTMGTPLYMSPEQIEGRPVDVRSDLYSLGVTAYHLLSGEPPFRGDTPLAVAVQHLNNTASPLVELNPDLPGGLSSVVERLMAKRPEERHQSPGELLAELRTLAKAAAEEGWAEGPENWGSADLGALGGNADAAVQQLGEMMKQAGRLGPQPARWLGAPAAALVAGMLLLGAVGAWALQPAPLLPTQRAPIDRKESPLAQLYHAKRVDTELAWRAVKQYHPELDNHYEIMADQGLARLLLSEGKYEPALKVCLRLQDLAGQTDRYAHRFSLAGMTVAFVGMGFWDQARESVAMLTSEHPYELEELEQLEPKLYRLYSEALDRLNGSEAARPTLLGVGDRLVVLSL